MNSHIATVIYLAVIAGLFWLDRDRNKVTSKWLWIPVLWLWISASRPASQWFADFGLGAAQTIDSVEEMADGSPFDRNVFLILLLIGVYVLVKRSTVVKRILRQNWPLLVFFGYCLLSCVWSDFPAVAAKRWIKALGNLVMVLVVLTEADRTAAVRKLMSRLGFVLIPLSILYIKYYPDLGRSYNRWTYLPFYNGVTDNKNGLGIVCFLAGAAAVWQLFENYGNPQAYGRWRKIGAQTLLIAMIAWLLYMANSMTSLSCFMMTVCILFATRLRFVTRQQVLIHVMVVAMLAVPIYVLFFNSSPDVLNAMGRDATLTGRTELWQMVLKLSGNPLLGTGFESFWLGSRLEAMWAAIWWHPNEAHNGYLETYLSLGWIGVVLLAIVIGAGYWNSMRSLRYNPVLGRLKLAFLVSTCAFNISEAALKGTDPIWIVFLLAATAVPLTAAAQPSSREDEEQEALSDEPEQMPVAANYLFRADNIRQRTGVCPAQT